MVTKRKLTSFVPGMMIEKCNILDMAPITNSNQNRRFNVVVPGTITKLIRYRDGVNSNSVVVFLSQIGYF